MTSVIKEQEVEISKHEMLKVPKPKRDNDLVTINRGEGSSQIIHYIKCTWEQYAYRVLTHSGIIRHLFSGFSKCSHRRYWFHSRWTRVSHSNANSSIPVPRDQTVGRCKHVRIICKKQVVMKTIIKCLIASYRLN